jgi:hypothetical protein
MTHEIGQFEFISSALLLSFGENMITAECDEEGRLRLSPEVRQRYGRKFCLVEAPGELVLLPVPYDAVKDLEEWGKPLRGMSLAAIKRAIQEQADKEVSG